MIGWWNGWSCWKLCVSGDWGFLDVQRRSCYLCIIIFCVIYFVRAYLNMQNCGEEKKKPYTVYYRYIAVVYITESDISHVGPHFLATHFADMAPKSAIFLEIAVILWTPFAGDSFSQNLLTAVTFDLARRRQFFVKSALGQSGLPVKCGREHMLCDGEPQKADHWHLHCFTEWGLIYPVSM